MLMEKKKTIKKKHIFFLKNLFFALFMFNIDPFSDQ